MVATYRLKIKANTYSIGVSPSSRAICRTCKGKVAKGEIRVVTHAPVRPYRKAHFIRHVACVSLAQAHAMAAAHGSIEDVPTDHRIDADDIEAAREQLKSLSSRSDTRQPTKDESQSLLSSMLTSPVEPHL